MIFRVPKHKRAKFWIAIFALIGIIAGNRLQPYVGDWTIFTNAVLALFAAAGIIDEWKN